jgi:hypothetical protein
MPATPRGTRPAGASVNIDRVRRAGAPARACRASRPGAFRVARAGTASRAAAPRRSSGRGGASHAGPQVERRDREAG